MTACVLIRKPLCVSINVEVPTRVATQTEEILRALFLGCLTVYTFIYIYGLIVLVALECVI